VLVAVGDFGSKKKVLKAVVDAVVVAVVDAVVVAVVVAIVVAVVDALLEDFHLKEERNESHKKRHQTKKEEKHFAGATLNNHLPSKPHPIPILLIPPPAAAWTPLLPSILSLHIFHKYVFCFLGHIFYFTL